MVAWSRLLSGHHVTCLFVKCSLGSLTEIPEATRNPPVSPESSVFWWPLLWRKDWKVCGRWGKREDVAGSLSPGPPASQMTYGVPGIQGKVCLQGKGFCLPCGGLPQGKRTLTPQQRVFTHPPPPVCWYNSIGSKLIYRKLIISLLSFSYLPWKAVLKALADENKK